MTIQYCDNLEKRAHSWEQCMPPKEEIYEDYGLDTVDDKEEF
ncbi:MAG: hypothetical protein ACQET3_08900 [Promethearchaeati archaeon]